MKRMMFDWLIGKGSLENAKRCEETVIEREEYLAIGGELL